jgi:lipopolysaccharide transport system permease protein
MNLATLSGPRWLYLRDLLFELVVRDMKLRYQRSLLGMAWSLLNPLAQLIVLSFVFGVVLPLNIPSYTVFLFCGLLPWSWFQTSLYTGSAAVVTQPELVRRPGFPTAILPVVTVSTQLLHFLIALPILLVFLILNDITLTAWIFTLPAIILVQYLFTLSLVYFLSSINVFFRDTQYLINIALLLGFYLSPVFYDPSSIPAPYQWLYNLNPMVALINSYRSVLMYGEPAEWFPLLVIWLVSAVLLSLGMRVFNSARTTFVEEL